LQLVLGRRLQRTIAIVSHRLLPSWRASKKQSTNVAGEIVAVKDAAPKNELNTSCVDDLRTDLISEDKLVIPKTGEQA